MTDVMRIRRRKKMGRRRMASIFRLKLIMMGDQQQSRGAAVTAVPELIMWAKFPSPLLHPFDFEDPTSKQFFKHDPSFMENLNVFANADAEPRQSHSHHVTFRTSISNLRVRPIM
jgi:hypothetical protein